MDIQLKIILKQSQNVQILSKIQHLVAQQLYIKSITFNIIQQQSQQLSRIQKSHRQFSLKQIYKKINEYVYYFKNLKGIEYKSLVKFNVIPYFNNLKKYFNCNNNLYQTVTVGGVFDYLHFGHKLLLTYCVLSAQKQLVIGITGSEKLFKDKKNKQIIQSFSTRRKNVIQFIKLINPSLKLSIYYLSYLYGPAIDRQDINAIVVSQETRQKGPKVNKIRKQRGFNQLQILICPAISQNQNKENSFIDKISSSNIRQDILKKNSMNIQQFIKYKQYWNLGIESLINILKIKQKFKNQLIDLFQNTNEWFDKVINSYSQYWRYYYTNYYVFSLLKQHKKLIQNKQVQLNQVEQVIIIFSIFFYHFVFIPNDDPLNNKIKSIQYMKIFFQNCFYDIIQFENKQELIKIMIECQNCILKKNNSNLKEYINKLEIQVFHYDRSAYQKYLSLQIKKKYDQLNNKQNYNQKNRQFELNAN